MERMLSEIGLDFNALEKEIYKIGCEYAANLMGQVLCIMDEHLEKTRDKKEYRHKGKRCTTLKTLMGEVTYGRTVYERKGLNGEKTFVYLLDKALAFDTFGKVTSNLAVQIAECVSVCSYREAAEKVSGMLGQTISRGGAWNVVQDLGKRMAEVEEIQAKRAKSGQGQGRVVTPILFEEADGVWINMQGKDRPRIERKCEMKMAAAYAGWEKKGADRYQLQNKVLVCGFEGSKDFQHKKEGVIASVFEVDEITVRILNGDGGGWIKEGLSSGDVHFQLDPFHKNREITRKVKDKGQRATIKRLLWEKRVADCLSFIQGIGGLCEDEGEKKKLNELYEYFRSNQDGLLPYQERGLKLPEPPEGVYYRNLGTMEHHVCDAAAKRMKHQKASWSKQGAENLGRLLCRKVCGNLSETVTSLSRAVLPEVYSEEIEAVLSAAKAPIKDGNGYRYPVNGGRPFAEGFLTNGRQAILHMFG